MDPSTGVIRDTIATNAAEGSPLTLTINATDPDGDIRNYSMSGPTGATFNATTRTFAWTPTDGDATIAVTCTVTDSGSPQLSNTETVTITVTNVAPTLTLSGAASVDEGYEYTLTFAATDPGEDTIRGWTIHWGDGTSDVVDGSESSATHVYEDGPNNYSISVSASAEDGTFASANELAVLIKNVAPTLSGLSVEPIEEGETAQLTGTITARTRSSHHRRAAHACRRRSAPKRRWAWRHRARVPSIRKV